jgi:mercuric ion transport protein
MREDKKLAATTGGAISISAIASFIGLCCIGPWAIAMFGVSGAIAMARWQPVRPYILGVALLLLAWAFWRVYGPPRKRLCEAGLCPTRPSLWLQGSLWLAALLVVMAFFADQLQWLLVDPTPEGLRE